eukprot:1726654-Pleurochrysis_carterae.AAC.1
MARHSMLTYKCVSALKRGLPASRRARLCGCHGVAATVRLATRRPTPCSLVSSLSQPVCGSDLPRCRLVLCLRLIKLLSSVHGGTEKAIEPWGLLTGFCSG